MNFESLDAALSTLLAGDSSDAGPSMDVIRNQLSGADGSEKAALVLRLCDAARMSDMGVSGKLVFLAAEALFSSGDLASLDEVFREIREPMRRRAALNALWAKPPSQEAGEYAVRCAVENLSHSDHRVRTEACSVVQNQAGWKTDVALAIPGLLACLRDREATVRMQAGAAVGNVAKGRRRYDLGSALQSLQTNLSDSSPWVRQMAGWALWQLAKKRVHDLSSVPSLFSVLSRQDSEREDRKAAIGALLAIAKISDAARLVVLQASRAAELRLELREVDGLLRKLEKVS